ncbi:MAG: hypothetical protein ABGY75_14275 [Gemmataceae bacterium]
MSPLKLHGLSAWGGKYLCVRIGAHPKELVDPNWAAEHRQQVVDYLKNGIELCEEMGCFPDLFGDRGNDDLLGPVEITDGVWHWQNDLPLYVERNSVRLPDEFIAHAASNRFVVPEPPSHFFDLWEQKDVRSYVSYKKWFRWCREYLAKRR